MNATRMEGASGIAAALRFRLWAWLWGGGWASSGRLRISGRRAGSGLADGSGSGGDGGGVFLVEQNDGEHRDGSNGNCASGNEKPRMWAEERMWR